MLTFFRSYFYTHQLNRKQYQQKSVKYFIQIIDSLPARVSNEPKVEKILC